MKEEADGFLLYCMSCRGTEGDRRVSDMAAKEFHGRYVQPLYSRCRRLCQNLAFDEPNLAFDLCSCTFAKAAEKASTFVDVPNEPVPSKRTLRWLATIARNLLVDRLRNPRRPGPINASEGEVPVDDYSDADVASLLCAGESLQRDQRTIELVRKALGLLDPRTHAVIVQTVLQRQRSPKGSYMYRGAATALAERFDTSPENVRRIRRDGIRKLAEYVREHSR